MRPTTDSASYQVTYQPLPPTARSLATRLASAWFRIGVSVLPNHFSASRWVCASKSWGMTNSALFSAPIRTLASASTICAIVLPNPISHATRPLPLTNMRERSSI